MERPPRESGALKSRSEREGGERRREERRSRIEGGREVGEVKFGERVFIKGAGGDGKPERRVEEDTDR